MRGRAPGLPTGDGNGHASRGALNVRCLLWGCTSAVDRQQDCAWNDSSPKSFAVVFTCSSLRLAEDAEAAAAAGAAGAAGSEGCTVSDISDSQPARFSVSCVSRICRRMAYCIRGSDTAVTFPT